MDNNKLLESLKILDEEIKFIYDNETSFLDAFCKLWKPEELIEISFNGKQIKHVFLNNKGASICNSVHIIKYLKWKENIINE